MGRPVTLGWDFCPRRVSPTHLICIALHRGAEEVQDPAIGPGDASLTLNALKGGGVSAPAGVQEAPSTPRRRWVPWGRTWWAGRGWGGPRPPRWPRSSRSTHLEVAHGDGGVGEEALAEGDLQAGFLHPLVQVIEGLGGGGGEGKETTELGWGWGGQRGWGASSRGWAVGFSTGYRLSLELGVPLSSRMGPGAGGGCVQEVVGQRWGLGGGGVGGVAGAYRGEDLRGLLDGGDLGPAPLLEELDAGGVVEGGRGVGAEEGGEALAVGQGGGAGAVRELEGCWGRGVVSTQQSVVPVPTQQSSPFPPPIPATAAWNPSAAGGRGCGRCW